MAEYIRKEDVLDAVKHAWAKGIEPSQYIESLESANVVPVVHGKWIKEYWHGETVRRCSVCKITQTVNVYEGKVKFNYCPYCGAKMDERSEHGHFIVNHSINPRHDQGGVQCDGEVSMGKKYIIELEDKPFELLNKDGITSEKLYRVKGFNSLVFDWNGLQMLTPYTEPDLDAIRKEAYEQGRKDGKIEGQAEMWLATKTIYGNPADCAMTNAEVKEIFGDDYELYSIPHIFSAAEAIDRIRAWERKPKPDPYEDCIRGYIYDLCDRHDLRIDQLANVVNRMRRNDA